MLPLCVLPILIKYNVWSVFMETHFIHFVSSFDTCACVTIALHSSWRYIIHNKYGKLPIFSVCSLFSFYHTHECLSIFIAIWYVRFVRFSYEQKAHLRIKFKYLFMLHAYCWYSFIYRMWRAHDNDCVCTMYATSITSVI